MLNLEQNSQHAALDKNKALEALLRSHQTRIRVVGCGGAGNNTITRLMEAGVKGVETLAINTDAQNLLAATADDKILIGQNITKGLGAGSNPQIGEDSARENLKEIEEALLNTDLVFVTCGLGGGTGTGSAPVVAEIAKRLGALTISIVTLPFGEEGVSRWKNAQSGLEKLRQHSDTVIVIENDRLLEIVPDLPLDVAFKTADEILVNAVKGITELITEKGLINLDFADVRTIMQNGGTAMIGLGESDGAESALSAVEMAMQNRLLNLDISGAKNALINITGGAHMPLKDAQMVMKIVAEKLDPSAKIIWGARIDQNLGNAMRVMLMVTGLQGKNNQLARRHESTSAAISEPPAFSEDKTAPSQEDVLSPDNSAEKLPPESDLIAPEIEASDQPAQPLIATASSAAAKEVNEINPAVKRKHKTPPAKSRKRSEAPATPPESGTRAPQAAPDEVVRVTFADGLALPNDDFKAPVPASPAPSASVPNSPLRTSRDGENTRGIKLSDETVKPTVKPFDISVGRSEPAAPLAKPNLEPAPISKSTAAAAEKIPIAGPMDDGTTRIAPKTVPSAGKTNDYNKVFAEQSRVHLQIIQESIGHLFKDPTRQETLRRIKHAAIAVNNLAKRFVFDVIAAYAATIEEICERVLDSEITMNKKLVNAFTEIPAIFDSLVHGDADALVEAKRHQERLQRLADSFGDGEVVSMDVVQKRNAAGNSAAPPMTHSQPQAAPALKPPQVTVMKTPFLSERRPRPATEVMEYLDDLFTEGKKTTGR
ncbi:MAG: cell division protein FtsZ [candidate division KSB1 bacterium]|nr:cell division protein FtsZ [candidate division KSB1 bacterium]MDZ7368188.1 cell division protein FtsZ [candidate division KSB1 bacterium]MDZ7405921.1 cell division protein FtsZ [candidate division KSB1 bacterium]